MLGHQHLLSWFACRGALTGRQPPSRRLLFSAAEIGDYRNQLGGVDRFRQVRLKTDRETAQLIFAAAVGGERDGWNCGKTLRTGTQLFQERIAVLAGHADVADQQIGAPTPQYAAR